MKKIYVITTEDRENFENNLYLYDSKEKAEAKFNELVNKDLEEYKPENYELSNWYYWNSDAEWYWVSLFEQEIL